MSHLAENTFSSYQLTDEEVTQGSLLTITQKQVIQNDIALCAEEKIALEYDAQNPHLFIQQESKLSGQIQALRHRLDCSEAAEARTEAINNPPENLEY